MTNNSPALHTSRFDVGRYLAGDAVMADYLTDCFEEGGTALFLKAIGEVARARGMSELANRTRPHPRKPLQGARRRRQSCIRHARARPRHARVPAVRRGRTRPRRRSPGTSARNPTRVRVMRNTGGVRHAAAVAKTTASKAKKARKPAAKKR